MTWQDFGIPGFIVLIAGAVFLWYQRLTKATINNLKSKNDLLKSNIWDLERKIGTKELEIADLTKYINYYPDEQDKNTMKILLSLFDRRALTYEAYVDFMHWGGVSLFINSLNELRIQLQKNGVSTIKSTYLKDKLTFIISDIERMVDFSIIFHDLNSDDFKIALRITSVMEKKDKISGILLHLKTTAESIVGNIHVKLNNQQKLDFERDILRHLLEEYYLGIIDEFKFRTTSHLEDIQKTIQA